MLKYTSHLLSVNLTASGLQLGADAPDFVRCTNKLLPPVLF